MEGYENGWKGRGWKGGEEVVDMRIGLDKRDEGRSGRGRETIFIQKSLPPSGEKSPTPMAIRSLVADPDR